MAPGPQQSNRQLDSISLIIIGAFFTFFSVLVLLGTFWEHRPHAMVVNLAAGFTLMAVGCGMAGYGYRLRRDP